MTSFAHTIKSDWPRFLIEIIVLVIGISLSFLLNEWRVSRDARQTEIRLIQGLRQNLVADSLSLGFVADRADRMRRAYDRLASPAVAAGLPDDSLDGYMDLLISYTRFTPKNITYEEMKQTGSSGLISNAPLLESVIDLYNAAYIRAFEWDDINRQFILERMVPYLDEHSPYVPAEVRDGVLSNRRPVFDRLVRDDPFLNLITTNRLFKQVQRSVYLDTRSRIDALVRRLDAELIRLGG